MLYQQSWEKVVADYGRHVLDEMKADGMPMQLHEPPSAIYMRRVEHFVLRLSGIGRPGGFGAVEEILNNLRMAVYAEVYWHVLQHPIEREKSQAIRNEHIQRLPELVP